jgi:type IV pilus assembly protein PilE
MKTFKKDPEIGLIPLQKVVPTHHRDDQKLSIKADEGILPKEADSKPSREVRSLEGFTLVEIIVVVILIGILASIALPRYIRIVEKGRAAEAKHNLGLIRDAELAYYIEFDAYTANLTALQLTTIPANCTSSFYFNYSVAVAGAAFTATADRCTAGGKTPNYSSGTYGLNLTDAGILDGTAGFV